MPKEKNSASDVGKNSSQARYGNKNAVGHGAPIGNQNAVGNKGGGQPMNKNAVKHGFFIKWLPEDTKELFNDICLVDPIDILWQNICIQYAAIIRAQKISYVKDQDDKTKELISDGVTMSWDVQQGWEKQSAFLNAQSRAMEALSRMLRQYDEMLHERWEDVSDEQKARIAVLKARAEALQRGTIDDDTDDGVVIIDDTRD